MHVQVEPLPACPPAQCLPAHADAALVCCLLAIYTDLVDWNAAGAFMGMN